jgi:hypothetical protein
MTVAGHVNVQTDYDIETELVPAIRGGATVMDDVFGEDESDQSN